MKYLYKETL